MSMLCRVKAEAKTEHERTKKPKKRFIHFEKNENKD